MFFRSLHRLVGLWLMPFALLFALTGIWYFIEGADNGGFERQIGFETPAVDTTNIATEDLTCHIDYDKAILIARYGVAWHVIFVVSLCWAVLAYYIYVRRMKAGNQG